MVKFNTERPRIVVKRLHKFFSTTDSLKATISPPEIIEKGSRAHFLYLFYGCLLDYGMKSSAYHKNLKNAYQNDPNLFDPFHVAREYEENVQNLAVALKEFLKVRFPNEGAKKWLLLSQILLKEYKGDPRNIFKPFMKFDEIEETIFSIKGFGQKTGGLLIRILYENGLIKTQDRLTHIPIDRHDMEISKMLGILETKKSEKIENNRIVIEQLSSIWVGASLTEDIDPCETDRNLWLLGSLLCSKKKCFSCPVNDLCVKIKEDSQ